MNRTVNSGGLSEQILPYALFWRKYIIFSVPKDEQSSFTFEKLDSPQTTFVL